MNTRRAALAALAAALMITSVAAAVAADVQNPEQIYGPTWSPDGRKIAFLSDRDGTREVYVMNADGTGQLNVTRSPANEDWLAWLPARTN